VVAGERSPAECPSPHRTAPPACTRAAVVGERAVAAGSEAATAEAAEAAATTVEGTGLREARWAAGEASVERGEGTWAWRGSTDATPRGKAPRAPVC
jgi:hypothetical protein